MGAYIIPITAASLMLIVVSIVVMRYALTPRITAPLCGSCRYDVTGLPSEICPECGANLHLVGVLKPGSVKPMSGVMKFALWSLSVAAIGVIATPPILRSIPPLQQMKSSATLASPRTQLYELVSIDGVRSWRGQKGAAMADVVVTLKRLDGQLFTMHASPTRQLCWYTNEKGKTQRGELPSDDLAAAGEAVEQWLNTCGIAANGNALELEAQEIAQAIAQAGDSKATFQGGGRMIFGSMNGSMSTQIRSFSFNSSSGKIGANRAFSMGMGPYSSTAMSFNSGNVNDPWPKRWVIGGWGLVWLLGVLVIVLTSSRRYAGESRHGHVPVAELPTSTPTPMPE